MPAIRAYLEPVQIGLSEGGAAKLVLTIHQVLDLNPTLCAIKVDAKNAFNAMRRARVVQVLEAEPTLSHMAQFAATVLTPVQHLESGGTRWGLAAEGLLQG
jgi:hypothetical protein